MNRFPNTDERRKREVIQAELDKGKLLIHLDPSADAVLVPHEYKDESVLALNFSHHFPFANTTVGPFAIEANLSFGGQRFQCSIPYAAVFCITQTTTNQQTWFPESLPESLKKLTSDGEAEWQPPQPSDAEVPMDRLLSEGSLSEDELGADRQIEEDSQTALESNSKRAPCLTLVKS